MNYVDINRPETQSNDWSSPVVKQYGVHFTPYFKIYDPSGALVAEGDIASQKVWNMMATYGIK